MSCGVGKSVVAREHVRKVWLDAKLCVRNVACRMAAALATPAWRRTRTSSHLLWCQARRVSRRHLPSSEATALGRHRIPMHNFFPPPSQPAQAPGCFPLPAPPPPPPSVGGGSIAGSRADRADAVVVVEWGEKGRISFYNKGARFEAVCFKHGPGCCKLTRTGAAPKGSRSLSRLAQGRPAGLLAAWLDSADNSNIARAADHKNPFWIAGVSRAQRSAARGKLKGMPFGLDLLSCERAQREEEMSEPEDVP